MARARRDEGKSLEQIKKEAQARAAEQTDSNSGGDVDRLPDGGWGWMVVLASFICNVIVDGVCYSFGIFVHEYMEEFKTSNEQTGWVGSLLAGFYLTVGPIVSVLAERYGSRKVTIAGAIIACAGFLLSTQASSIGMLIVTWGVIGGIGFGMIYLPAIVTVGHWFDQKRAFATGLAVCGTGVGTFIFAPLTSRLIEEYEWRGAHLIIAGIVLNCVVCGIIFRPLDKVKPRRECYQSQVEIQRGAIMKALIEEKKRQRTISNGSLDNCIITKDNRLIKIDPALLECKRNNSFISRFKRSLGFSSQSLNRSKSSLQNMPPSILVDLVNEAAKSEAGSARVSPIYRPRPMTNSSPSNNNLRDMLKSDGSDSSSDSGVYIDAHAKLNSQAAAAPDTMSLNETWLIQVMQNQSTTATLTEVHSKTGSSHSINIPGVPRPGMDGSIISVQVLPNYSSADGAAFPRQRSHRSSESSSCYNNPGMARSSSSFVSRSFMSIPQGLSQCSIETYMEEAEAKRRNRGILMMILHVLKDMVDVQLLLNPMFGLLVVASILTLIAFFIPFFYIATKAEEIGMGQDEAVFLLSVIGITNTIGRVISGWIADRPWTNVLHLNNGALIVAGIGTILVSAISSYVWLCVYSAVFGFCVAVFVSLRSILLVELLGLELLTKSFGMLILFQGIATMTGAPLAGRLLDTTQTVDGCFIMAGVLLLVSGLMGFPLWYIKRRRAACSVARCHIPLMQDLDPINVGLSQPIKLEPIGSTAI